jgi:hypothetical protein
MTLINAEFLRKIERLDPDVKDVIYPMVEVLERPHEEGVTKIEFNELKNIVADLAEAQKQLAEAQERTEKNIDDLTAVVKNLVGNQEKMREELGGLGMNVGYTLENEAFKKLPELLKKDFGIQVKQRLKRTYVRDIDGKSMEVNIFGQGEKDGKEITIIGESKAQLSKKKVNNFFQENVRRLHGVYPEIFLVIVTYMITAPGVDDYVKKKGIALYYSYDF